MLLEGKEHSGDSSAEELHGEPRFVLDDRHPELYDVVVWSEGDRWTSESDSSGDVGRRSHSGRRGGDVGMGETIENMFVGVAIRVN